MTYDFIIAGAGLGGLSFVHQLMDSGSEFSSILVIDQDRKNVNDRTWSFWTKNTPIYKCALQQSWSKLGFASDDYIRFEEIAPYTYYTIHSGDFYKEVFDKINDDKRITFIRGIISNIECENDLATIQVGDRKYQAEYIIDSVTRPDSVTAESIMLSQNFVGWKIRTDYAAFDPEKPILMDFRVSQTTAPSFVYFLPYSDQEALVEYTQFSPHFHFDEKIYESEIENYISSKLGVSNYTIAEKEKGSIPMTNFPFNKKPYERVYRIGTVGGDTKPTTGYTFINVQKRIKSILEELNGVTTTLPEWDRFAFYDTLLLQIMRDQPSLVKKVMKFLFKNQPMPRILKFLDEETTIPEEMLIMGQLPWLPFLSTLLKRTGRAITS